MDYKKAVEAALKGNESAFSALYESTQRDMYYIALKYMKNEEDAMDVLQDSYIKAWQSLATLKDPASFRAWFGRIVANTAKNALAKKRPMLFSQLEGENDEGEQFALDIEDEKSEFQPERSYTQKETQELVHELIDSLSDEQRLCILMYHLDDQSIKDIAETFGISENTVKSRLLYGRKAIKAKAEELQKKGYQLYTVAPVVFFMEPNFTMSRRLYSSCICLTAKKRLLYLLPQPMQLCRHRRRESWRAPKHLETEQERQKAVRQTTAQRRFHILEAVDLLHVLVEAPALPAIQAGQLYPQAAKWDRQLQSRRLSTPQQARPQR